MFIDQPRLSFPRFSPPQISSDFCKMQIHPDHSTYACPATTQRLNASIQALKNTSSKELDTPRTLHGCSAARLPTSAKPTKIIRKPDPGCSWREEILGLFDPALQDAEDMMLSLPYTDIREKTNTLATMLDERAASRPLAAINRTSSGSPTSTKAWRNCAPLSTGYAASDGSSRGLTSAASSANRPAGQASHSQDCDSTVVAKTMCVASSFYFRYTC